jgi:predicted alpha/beta hydrolase family esterase
MSTTYFIIPGLGNSGETHWQTHFETTGSNFKRIEQAEWDAPLCHDWIQRIDEALASEDLANVVLIGHSLGCITIAHWAQQTGKTVRGAMLVAPSDLEAEQYKNAFPAKGFTPIPRSPLPFRTVVVGSENDPWMSGERARYFADLWGSEFVSLGDAGHINVASGYGPWPQGLQILSTL